MARSLLLCVALVLPLATMGSVAQADTFTFTVTADMRGHHDRFDTLCQQINTQVGGPGVFHVSCGDIDSAVWENRQVIDDNFGPNFPWYPVIGNHELVDVEIEWLRDEYDNGNGARTPLKNHTNQDGPNGTTRLCYTWDYGNAHFIALNEYWDGGPNEGSGQSLSGSDTGTDGDVVPELYAWLAADLAANTRDFVFVFGHEPAYPYTRHVGDSLDKYVANRDAFWALLESYGVVAYFCGHTHYYSKHRNPGGTVWQMDAGNAGNAPSSSERQTFFHVVVSDTEAQIRVWRNAETFPDYSFHEAITGPNTTVLKIMQNNDVWGQVSLDPEPNEPMVPLYPVGTEVTLTAEPNDGKSFRKWKVFDANDANDFVIDTNNPITIDMVADRKVKAFFKCGGGGLGLPLLALLTVGGVALLRKRWGRWGD